MQFQSDAQKVFTYAACVGIGILLILIWFADSFKDGSALDWFPQVAITLAGFVGASWFAGRRLDLLDKGIQQRQDAATEQLLATERGNLNSAVKEAVNMLNGPLPSVLAGQRWLHQIALVGQEEAELVRALLCSHIASSGQSSNSPDNDPLDADSRIKARQSALNLLFGKPGKERYAGCQDPADLRSIQWRELSFAGLDLTDTIFSGGDFTDAVITGARFDGSNLRETTWASNVPFGGNMRTRMENADMRGVFASSCIFDNISFRGAKMGTDGPESVFKSCTFKNCDFEGADWTGAVFNNPDFDQSHGVTFELCLKADLTHPSRLPRDVHEQLQRAGRIRE